MISSFSPFLEFILSIFQRIIFLSRDDEAKIYELYGNHSTFVI